jgi:hypothetical protein
LRASIFKIVLMTCAIAINSCLEFWHFVPCWLKFKVFRIGQLWNRYRLEWQIFEYILFTRNRLEIIIGKLALNIRYVFLTFKINSKYLMWLLIIFSIWNLSWTFVNLWKMQAKKYKIVLKLPNSLSNKTMKIQDVLGILLFFWKILNHVSTQFWALFKWLKTNIFEPIATYVGNIRDQNFDGFRI